LTLNSDAWATEQGFAFAAPRVTISLQTPAIKHQGADEPDAKLIKFGRRSRSRPPPQPAPTQPPAARRKL
jgi:hypothetical protein